MARIVARPRRSIGRTWCTAVAAAAALLLGPGTGRAQDAQPTRRLAVLLLSLGDVEQDLADNLTEVLIAALAERLPPGTQIVGKEELQAVLRTVDVESHRCLETPACLGRVGVQLGVDEVVSGVVGARPDGHALSVTRTVVATGEVPGRHFEQVPGGLAELVRAVQAAAPALAGAPTTGTGAAAEPPTTGAPPPAQPSRAPGPAPRFARTGLVLELGLGAGGVTTDDHVGDDIDVRPLVAFPVLAVLYRPVPYLSAGLLASYTFLSARSPDVDPRRAGALSLSAGLRGHLPLGRFEPWLGLGLGYVMHHGAAEVENLFAQGVIKLWFHGLGLDVSAGLALYATERLVLSVFGRFVAAFWQRICYRIDGTAVGSPVEEEECNSVEEHYEQPSGRSEVPDLPHLWQAGLSVAWVAL